MSQMVTSDRLDFQRGVQSEPLSDQDIQLVHRMLSDPSVFPREFKRWVTEHASDTVDIAKTQVHGLVNSTGQVVIGGASLEMLGATLCGFCIPYPAAIPPAGWLLCDGHEVLRADYQSLFGLIGTVWGTPTDGTKFKLPDFRDRAPYGVGTVINLAGNEGLAAGARGGPKHYHDGPSHQHYFSDTKYHEFGGGGQTDDQGNHDHTYQRPGSSSFVAGGSAGGTFGGAAQTGSTGSHRHNYSVTVGGNVHLEGWSQLGGTGPTSGGYGKDGPSYLGINWICGSGVVPP
jgi:microcystin-dependent protein